MGSSWPRGFSGSIYQDDLADSKATERESNGHAAPRGCRSTACRTLLGRFRNEDEEGTARRTPTMMRSKCASNAGPNQIRAEGVVW